MHAGSPRGGAPNRSSFWRCTVCNASNSSVNASCTSCGNRPGVRTAAQQQQQHAEQQRQLQQHRLQQQQQASRAASTSSQSTSPVPGSRNADSASDGVSDVDDLRRRMESSNQQQRSQGQQHHQAVMQQHRQSQEALMRAMRDAEAHKEQVEYLQQVLTSSRQYGRDVEAAIEHLANMLHKKTVECENLRALATENYGPLRNAVRAQFETTVRQEARQQTELRHLQAQIEQLVGERSTLQSEIASLKILVKELEAAPPHASYNPSDKGLLFNRLAGGDPTGTTGTAAAGDRGTAAAADPTGGVASWNLSASSNATSNQSLRELLQLLSSIDEPTSAALDKTGMFDVLKVTAARMCTQVKGARPGTYPNLSEVVTQVLRERRDVSGGGAHGLSVEATGAVPQVATSDRQRVTQLFLANNPNQYEELNLLLTGYEGRERELYDKLRAQYDGTGPAEYTPMTAVGPTGPKPLDQPGDRADSTTELHARIMIMYRKYNASKIGTREVNDLLSKYPPELILGSLVEKYGPEPTGEERRLLIQGIA